MRALVIDNARFEMIAIKPYLYISDYIVSKLQSMHYKIKN